MAQPAMPSSTNAETHLIICPLIGSTSGVAGQPLQPVADRALGGQTDRSGQGLDRALIRSGLPAAAREAASHSALR